MGLISDLKKEGKRIEQFSGTAAAADAEHFAANNQKVILGLVIDNNDSSNDLQISVDGGAVYHVVPALGSYSLECDRRSFLVKRVGGAPAYTGRIAVTP